MKNLTTKQLRLLKEIKAAEQCGQSLSLTELGAKAGGIAPSGVFLLLKALEAKGYVEPRNGKSRSIQLTKIAKEGGRSGGLPIKASRVSGVCQWHADESEWGSSKIDADIFKTAPHCLIKAVGRTVYLKKGIRREDLLAVVETSSYTPSDVIAVNVSEMVRRRNGEEKPRYQVWVGTGIKKKTRRFIQTDGGVREIGPDDTILGVVVGVVRLNVTRNQ